MKRYNRYDDKLNDNADNIVSQLQSELNKSNKGLIFLGVFSIVLLFATFILYGSLKDTLKENEEYKDKLIKEEAVLSLEYSIGYWYINSPEEINDILLYNFLEENGAWYPDILLKQAKIESGNYTSNVFKANNNIYGMKRVYKRQTTQSGEGSNGYGKYNNWCLSVLDRLLWDIFTFNNEKPSRSEYLKAMEIYAEDPNYTKKLQ